MNVVRVDNLHILPSGPGNLDSIIMSGGWTEPTPYDDDGHVFTWDVEDPVPASATSVLVRIKLKAYVPHGAGMGYCQGNIRSVNPDAVMNHLGHVDEWSRDEGAGEGRRITYLTVFAPIKEGKIAFRVSYEIINRGAVEFIVYLEGYVARTTLGLQEITEIEEPEEPEQ